MVGHGKYHSEGWLTPSATIVKYAGSLKAVRGSSTPADFRSVDMPAKEFFWARLKRRQCDPVDSADDHVCMDVTRIEALLGTIDHSWVIEMAA